MTAFSLIDRLIVKYASIHPLTRGKMFLFRNFIRDKPRAGLLHALTNPIRMKQGFVLNTYSHADLISELCRCYRDYEPETRKTILANILPDTVFLDIGANFGAFSIGIAAGRPDIHVIGIEPNPVTYELLTRGIVANSLTDRVTCFQVALGERDGTVALSINESNSGDCSIAEGKLDTSGASLGKVEVPLHRLDSFAPVTAELMRLGKPVSCVKIDIQGAEVGALRGMREILRKYRPTVIIELEEESLALFGNTKGDLFEEFHQLGYRQAGIVEDNLIMRYGKPT